MKDLTLIETANGPELIHSGGFSEWSHLGTFTNEGDAVRHADLLFGSGDWSIQYDDDSNLFFITPPIE